MTVTHASLFSGIGGAELAATWMGWRNLFHCEVDPFCRRVLGYHYPESTSYGDIRETDFTPWHGKIDVLTGGFPCQPYSLAGKREGNRDDRALWPQMLRAIREIKPSWVVGENVAGILSMVESGREVAVGREASLFGEDNSERITERSRFTADAICESLEREGYSVQPFLIPACAVGAPHRRDRVWIIANRNDTGIEEVEQGRQDGVLSVGVATDTYSNRQRHGQDKQKPISERERTSDVIYVRKEEASTYAHGTGRREQHVAGKPEEPRYDTRICAEELLALRWAGFPTVKPVVRAGDDGLPGRLSGISFPKWREQSVKALGNSWVPQVAYEIFRAIQIEIDRDESNENEQRNPHRIR